MDDAISRSAVLAIINDRSYDTAYPSEHDELVSEINKIPTIDAVPVVRCKDCKHRQPFRVKGFEDVRYCEYTGLVVGDNAYCACGEVKGDDQRQNAGGD